MFTVLVTLDVLPGRVDEFLLGLRENARASLRDEPGCLRFEIHRSADDPCRFHLHEIYRDRAAFGVEHREAPHYAAWREVAARCVREDGHTNAFAVPEEL